MKSNLTLYLILVTILILTLDCKKDPPPPIADFSFTGDNRPAPCEIIFTNSSINTKSYSWEFGNGLSSKEKDPKHNYNAEGIYSVKLTVEGELGTNSITKNVTILKPSISFFKSYDSLVLVGYQGWFGVNGGKINMGWMHYGKYLDKWYFEPGKCDFDFWPDISEYPVKYKTVFKYEDGSDAYVFCSSDAETVDLHFRWMKEYGIDGVFMQRFKQNTEWEKLHFNTVLEHAIEAANKYKRAICIMYDLTQSSSSDMQNFVKDWADVQQEIAITSNPSYVRHRGKPLIAIWGVGFNDGRAYTLNDVKNLIAQLKGPENKVSILLGVPYRWRTLNGDCMNDPLLHEIIKSVDLIMPWSVGRYNSESYSYISSVLPLDITWCKDNNVDYVPCVFPGFSWGNLQNNYIIYDQIPRKKGDFFWQQVAGAKQSGAKSLYIAMFDEINEGTAIFKCQPENKLPLNSPGRFVGIEEGIANDYYLWLAGQASGWFRGKEGYNSTKPIR